MREWSNETAEPTSMPDKARRALIAKLILPAGEVPMGVSLQEQWLANEMRHNAASVMLNRALLEYSMESDHQFEAGRTSSVELS